MGILLTYYSRLKVAEIFSMLHALFRGRIDFGTGRGRGGSGAVTLALKRDRCRDPQVDDFAEQLTEPLGFIHGDFPPENLFSRNQDFTRNRRGCAAWTSLCVCQFIAAQATRLALRQYRENLQPSKRLCAPRTIFAVDVVCADT